MRVRFKTISAGPKGAIFPGDLLDVDEKEAAMLVKNGYAEYITPPAPAVEPKPEPADEETEEVPVTPRKPRRRPVDEI